MKARHEALPPTHFDAEKLFEAIAQIQEEQIKLSQAVNSFLSNITEGKPETGYEIITDPGTGSWLPEQGRLYTINYTDGSKIEFMMKGNLCCIEQTLQDGAVAYYEVDAEGSVKELRLPYPIEEYKVIVPDNLVARTEVLYLPNGYRKITKILKWRGKVTIIEDPHGRLKEADIQYRLSLSHKDREFRVINPKSVQYKH
jgi:hypothetical protein